VVWALGGGVWCISESPRQSKVSGCSDLQGTVEPGRNLYSILASAVPDQTKDQELAGEGEKRKGSVCLREQPAAEHERKRRYEYLVVLFGCSRPSGTEEQCGRRRPAVVGVLTIEEQEPDEVTGRGWLATGESDSLCKGR
jgi:hypothetical protein